MTAMSRTFATSIMSVCLLVICAVGRPASAAGVRKTAFGRADDLTGWELTGDAAFDKSRSSRRGGGSLKVAPGGKAVWRLRENDGSGRVVLKVFEDGTKRKNPDKSSVGPQWGVITATGRVLTAGALFAGYIDGNNSYAMTEFGHGETPFQTLAHLGLPRSKGWHEWTLIFGAKGGLRVLHNGKDVNKPRQRIPAGWNKKAKGFVGVVIIGDHDADKGQTVWVDDIAVAMGGETKVDRLAGIVPKRDPRPQGPRREIVPELAGVHPRLLFGADDVPALRAFAKTEAGSKIYQTFQGYAGASMGPPSHTNFLRDATDGQRQGLWRLPTAALHYVLTGEQRSFDETVKFMEFLLAQPHWETGEIDNGMSAANIMIGAALAYDWLYNDLDPDFRERYRQKLWEHARRMYHGGHLMGDNTGHHYWEMDPQNNHRWHRNAGMALCALASYTGEADQQWLMQKVYDELKFVVDWLPDDGTSHESFTYMIFGAAHLSLGTLAGDRCFGTDHMQRPFFANLARFVTQSVTPGLTRRFRYGDQAPGGVGKLNYDACLLLTAGMHGREAELALLREQLETKGLAANSAWMAYLWYPRETAVGKVADAPDRDFFPDMGLVTVRQGWDAGQAAAMFKCGPFGGYLLNKYRMERDYHYINVAHDDPDANAFLLFANGQLLAETDGYSEHKRTVNHNTILVNGTGQITADGRENHGFWQPARKGVSMNEIAVVTAFAQEGRNLGVEGEAAGSYPAIKKGKRKARGPKPRPALERYRRTFLWVEGKYVLVLDDIRAASSANIDWLMQGPQVEVVSARHGKFALAAEGATCPFMVASTGRLANRVVDAPADSRGKALGWKQLRLSTRTGAIRLATVFDLFGRGDLSVRLTESGPDKAVVAVRGSGVQDTWNWTAPAGRLEPSKIVGKTAGGEKILSISAREMETKKLIAEIPQPRK